MHGDCVIKRDHLGREVFRYDGHILARGPGWIQIEAWFAREMASIGPAVFQRGDRFIEWFYADRWYNIFEVRDRIDDHVKGWYCNLTRPAVLAQDSIAADDLALDLWIGPDGAQVVLDADEFAALALNGEERAAVQQALEDLRRAVGARKPPFYRIVP